MASTSSSQAFKPYPWALRYLFAQKKVFIPSLIALFVTAGLALGFPYFLKELLGNPADAMRQARPAAEVLLDSNRTIIQLLIVLALQAFIAYFRVKGFTYSGEAALNAMRQDIFDHLLRLPLSFFQSQRSGALSSRITGDLNIVRETLINTVPQAVRQTVILIGGLIFIFISSWKLSLIMLGCIPIVLLLMAFFGKRVRAYSKQAQEALTESGTVIEESVQSIFDVKTFTNEPFESKRYQSSLMRFFSTTMQGAQSRAAFLSFIIFALFGTIAFVVWYGARMYSVGAITWNQFTAFILFSIFVGASLGSFPEIISQFHQNRSALERILEIMHMAPERTLGSTFSFQEKLTFKDVQFRYPSRPEQLVLRHISFTLQTGKKIAFVGPSGAGKSTLFSLILGLNQPEKGTITFDDQALEDISLESLRSQIAVVPQEVMLFGGTIFENISYGKNGAHLDEVIAAAQEANAHDFITQLPHQYQTVVGPRGVMLSGGQRQRIAIARALLANPKLLLLDEATSALDAESERLVHQALERLMLGRTSIIIAHRLSTVRHADHIFVMNQGEIVEEGTHDALLAQAGTYKLLVETQLQ